MMKFYKEIGLFFVAFVVAGVYFYASAQLKERDKKNYEAGITKCELAHQQVVIIKQNEVIKTKTFQRKIASRPDLDTNIVKRVEFLRLIYDKRKIYNNK